MNLRYDIITVPGHSGRLILSPMPGLAAPLAATLAAVEKIAPAAVVCLTSREEIARKSPEYGKVLKAKTFPYPVLEYPIFDFSIPDERARFGVLVREVSQGITRGMTYWIHCAAGMGRTGLFAGCVLKTLGLDDLTVGDLLGEGRPETDEQFEWLAGWK